LLLLSGCCNYIGIHMYSSPSAHFGEMIKIRQNEKSNDERGGGESSPTERR
jgi:hypothetical protein